MAWPSTGHVRSHDAATPCRASRAASEPRRAVQKVGQSETFWTCFQHLYTSANALGKRDINIRNINLNSRFGFELEGVFLDDITVGGKHQDILRMALFKSLWLQIFCRGA